jgi:hypothetical protein
VNWYCLVHRRTAIHPNPLVAVASAAVFWHLTLHLLLLLLPRVPRSFFVIQLSSMITGWVAISALAGPLPKGTSVFSAVLAKVAAEGTGQTVLAALLLSSGALKACAAQNCCIAGRSGSNHCTAACYQASAVQCSVLAAVCAVMSTVDSTPHLALPLLFIATTETTEMCPPDMASVCQLLQPCVPL